MLEQTVHLIDALRKIGLPRNSFNVWTQRITRGKTFVGYGDTHCSLKTNEAMALVAKNSDVLAAGGYNVGIIRDADGILRHVSLVSGSSDLPAGVDYYVLESRFPQQGGES